MTGPADRAPRLADGLRTCLLVFMAVRIGLSLLSLAAATLLPMLPNQPVSVPGWTAHLPSPGLHNLFEATERQDALWYLRVATSGYSPSDGSAAFFPLYPLAIRVVAWLPGVGPLAAALLVSNGAFLGALVLLHGLVRLEGGNDPTARRTVLFLSIFPTAFFFLAPYSESLFLLTSLAAFWFARRDRWALAALSAALAAMTRSVGILLAPALVIEAFLQWRAGRPLIPRLGAAAATGAGPLLYLLFWQIRFRDFWAPWRAQRGWGRSPSAPSTTLTDAARLAARLGSYWLIDLAVVAVVVVAVLSALGWMRAPYITYAGLSLVLPLTDPFPDRPLLSMVRFVIVLFPAPWAVAQAVRRGWIPETLVTGVFAGGYGLLAVLFVSWHYIF